MNILPDTSTLIEQNLLHGVWKSEGGCLCVINDSGYMITIVPHVRYFAGSIFIKNIFTSCCEHSVENKETGKFLCFDPCVCRLEGNKITCTVDSGVSSYIKIEEVKSG